MDKRSRPYSASMRAIIAWASGDHTPDKVTAACIIDRLIGTPLNRMPADDAAVKELLPMLN
jgi:hypothetical protein